MSKKYTFFSNMYRIQRITAAQVWTYADKGEITNDEAVQICGPRPLTADDLAAIQEGLNSG